MSPFSEALKSLRKKRGLKQKDLANLLGYEPSYISAMERGQKGPPRLDFRRRLISGLRLDDEEKAQLENALRRSKRQIVLPYSATAAEYDLLHDLEQCLGHLSHEQIYLIRLAINIPGHSSAARSKAAGDGRVKTQTMTEAEM